MLAALAASLLLTSQAHGEYVAGYMIVPTSPRLDESYNAGYSMYVAVWPLLHNYPGHRFQTGLPGTWMFAQYDGEKPKDMYSDVEGGLGWWTDTRFPTATPKFIMGGVGPNFSEIANGPGHGAGDWEHPRGLYGVAQLSPWLLFPPDGLNLKQGMKGQLLGYGYLNLPLLDPKTRTDGQDFPTGGNCWTLFLNSENFKGPAAFFLPHFWSHAALKDPRLAGQLLDTRPADPNRAIQMETQYVPCRIAAGPDGEQYMRLDPTSFPVGPDGRSILLNQAKVYDKRALWDSVHSWFGGGPASKGAVDPRGASQTEFHQDGYMTWEVRTQGPDGKEIKVPLDWKAFATPTAIDPVTFGCRWDPHWVGRSDDLATFPEYFHLVDAADPKRAKWEPIAVGDVPAETGLRAIHWETPAEHPQEPYTTPVDPMSCWKKPGPVAGPFRVRLGDGTVVTYSWYRFCDQPALLNADLTPQERERLQARVVKLHRAWTKDRTYLAPPTRGTLASIDPALIVKPPKGLEAGYVPIATRQELAR